MNIVSELRGDMSGRQGLGRDVAGKNRIGMNQICGEVEEWKARKAGEK